MATRTRYRSGDWRPARKRCRVKGCGQSGFNRYCYEHTPEEGVGLVKCTACGEPCADHPLTGEGCLVRYGQ